MATNQLPTTLGKTMKAILRQMPGLGVGRIVPSTAPSALSAFTQRGAYPGLPVLTSSVSSMFLKVSGTIPEDELPITVRTLHGGMVGQNEAQWIWSQDIDADLRPVINVGAGKGSIDTVRGWEWPGYVTYYEAIVFDDAPLVDYPDAVTLSDGRIFQAYQVFDVGTSVSVIVKVRALDGTWTNVTVYENTDTTRTLMLPCLVALVDDRVLVYLMNYPPGGTTFQIQARVIDPVTLEVGDYEVACLKSSLAIATYGQPDEISQLRGAIKPDGTAVLLLSTDIGGDRHILQLGSYDYGHSFSVVSYGTGSQNENLPDIVCAQGVFVCSYVNEDAGTIYVYVKTLTHYFDSLADAPLLGQYSESAGGADDRHVAGNALVATPDGILYGVNSVYNDDVDESFGHVHVSLDLGGTWTDSAGLDLPNVGYGAVSPGHSWLHLIAPAAHTCAYLDALCATWQGNRLYVGSTWVNDDEAADSNDDGSLVAFYLGGASNQQKAFIDSLAKSSDTQLGYDLTAFGFVHPEYNGWTETTSGTAASGQLLGRTLLATADGGKDYFSKLTTGSEKYASVEWTIDGDVVNTLSHGDVGVEVTVDTGAARYKLGVYYLATSGTQGGIRLRDNVANSTIANIPIDWLANEMTYRVEVSSSKFQLWYRPAASDEDQVWERAIDPFDEDGNYTGYTLTSTTGGSTAAVIWGHLFATTTGATGDANTLWRDVKCNFGDNLATSSAASGIKYWFLSDYVDYASTDDFHNGYPFVAFPVWVSDGVYVTASGGPTYFGDEWEINPAYVYPVENILPEGNSSPLHHWESETDDDDVDIVWLVGTGDVEAAVSTVLPEWVRNESFACWMMGRNFKTAELWGTLADNSELKILDMSTTRFSSLTFDNQGNTTRVLAGGGTTYVAYNELVGSYLINSGETAPKLITENTEGQLNAATKAVTIRFEASLTEDQGVDVDTGNLIFGTEGLWVTHDPPANQFKAYRLHIPAQETAEGRFKIGKMMFNGLLVFGRPPSYAHTLEVPQDNTLLNKTQAGHTEVRVYNENPRVKQLSWVDGIDESGLSLATPDYVQYGSPADEPVALFSDTARQIYGLFQATFGASELVVYCESVPGTTNTGELHAERLFYGRITSSFQESNQLGEEGVSQVTQVTNVTIETEK